MSRRAQILLTLTVLLVGVLGVGRATQALDKIQFVPEVAFPGFNGTQTVDDNLTGRYIRTIYIYFVWTVGTLATVMVIYGGVKWVAAAGNPGRINDARETINNAIIGVIIALTSVVLLNLISPGFTSLGLPQIAGVKPITAGLASYNSVYNCYEKVTCPTNYTQTLGGQCGNGGVFSHSNPGIVPCQRSTAYGVCCKSADGKQCVGFSSKDGAKDYEGQCNAVTEAPPSYTAACQGQSACGSYDPTSGCRGVYCGDDQACYLKDSKTSGQCINPGTAGTILKFDFTGLDCGSGTASVFYTGSINCGDHATNTVNGQPTPIWGTKSSCPTGQYCHIDPPVRDPNGSQCVSFSATRCVSYDIL